MKPAALRSRIASQCRRGRSVLHGSVALLALALPGSLHAIQNSDLFAFGTAAGDFALSSYDSTNATNNTFIQTSWLGLGPAGSSLSLPFYGKSFSGLYVDDVGMVSFAAGVSAFVPSTLPVPAGYNSGDPNHPWVAGNPIIAPFWTDVDTRPVTVVNGIGSSTPQPNGHVWYRTVQDAVSMTSIGQLITSGLAGSAGFTPTFAQIVTWDHVGHYDINTGNAATDNVNTYQMVVASDGVHTYTAFLYPQTGTAGVYPQSGINYASVNEGSAGTPYATMGFDAGDGTHSYNGPASGTAGMLNIANTTNTVPTQAGVYLFRLDTTGSTTLTWNSGTGNFVAGGTNWTGGAAWNDGNSAIFGGTAGVVTLTGPVNALNLAVNTTGYTFTSSSTSNSLQFNQLALAAGNTVNFGGSLVVLTNAAEAITSGHLTFGGTSVLVARTANAVDGGAITLQNSAQIQLYSTGATTGATSLTFDSTLGGTGGTFDLRGFNTSIGAISSTGSAAGVIKNSVVGTPATLTVNFDTTASTFNGVIQNGGSTLALTKAGTGTFTLAGANTYTGATTITGGKLLVSGSLNGTASATVGDGINPATLGGTGTITPKNGGAITVTNAATLAPGAGGLTLNAAASGTASLALQSGSTFQLSMGNHQAAAQGIPALGDYSRLTLGTGVSATLGGNIVTSFDGFMNNGDLFTIILLNGGGGGTLTGTFANTTTPAPNSLGSAFRFTSNGLLWDINYAWTGSTPLAGVNPSTFEQTTGGHNVALLLVTVPEPGSAALLTLGASAALLARQRRRRLPLQRTCAANL